ncbi:hypothetical protein T4B_12003 [Trichinella pseudospiralis]|uniref:Uncharacterized protein n=1 Tax=Trichinella pseudospiralis TaxID=6337 RepID=A0A0V1G880_TRIPS|nr:hypothetical protein T4B_12003 [Trichinella pseudospiralis]
MLIHRKLLSFYKISCEIRSFGKREQSHCHFLEIFEFF